MILINDLKIIDVYNKTLSISECSKILNISVGYIYKRLKLNGFNTSLKGRKLSQEHREKVIKTLIKSPMLGKEHSEETRKKMSESRKGSGNSNWRGGLTKATRSQRRTKEYFKWRKLVLEKLNFICANCGNKENLEAHHIIPIKENRNLIFSVDNGICLCRDCHKKITFGGNNNAYN